MWYLSSDDITDLSRTEFNTQDEAVTYLKAQGFEQIDGGEDWTTYGWENFDGEMLTVTLTEA